MLPRKESMGRKEEDIERSRAIVSELQKMEKVDCKAMDPGAKRSFSIKKEELRGELFQITKGPRYAFLDETLEDLRCTNQFLEASEPMTEELEYFDHVYSTGAVEERCRRFLIVKTNRGQLSKLREILTNFRQTILHDSSSWSLDRFDEEKKKVEAQIGSLDLSEMSEEKLTKDQYELLLYALRTKNEVA